MKTVLTILVATTLKELGLERESPSSANINYTVEANHASLSGETLPHPATPNYKYPALIYRGIVPAHNILEHDFAINGAIVRVAFLSALLALMDPYPDVCE